MRVLFVAPKIANIYVDIISELERQGYEVDYYDYPSYKLDPHYLKGYVKYGRFFTSETISSFYIKRNWEKMLASRPYNKVYDYLFVIDGYSLHPCLFSILRERNPQLKTINYLFDSTYSNYEFNVHFPFFDRVATFDIKDSKKYGIDLLPIYWTEDTQDCDSDIFFFGLGTDIGQRMHLFQVMKEYSDRHGFNSYIRIFLRPLKNMRRYKIKYRLVKALSSGKVMTSPEHFFSPLITHEMIPTSEYRLMIKRAKVILDSNALHQDGLTARFMWALGAEKKIITTNAAVKQYDFYTPEQIFVVEDIDGLLTNSNLEDFLHNDFHMADSIREKVMSYRLDNWVKNLMQVSV